MGRPREEGLRYFSLDVDIFSNRKMKVLRAKFGSDGPQFYLYILCEAYRGKGYYLQTDSYFQETAAAEIGASCEKIGLMLDFLANKSMLLDGTLFATDKVLTSREIQRRFQEAKRSAGRKTPVQVDERFWLLDAEETETFIEVRHFEGFSGNNPDFSRKKGRSSRKNAIKESKGKESKGNERKGGSAEESAGGETPDWVAALPLALPPGAMKEIQHFLLQGLTRQLVQWAAGEAAGRGKPWGYARAILQDKLARGIQDVSELPGPPGKKGREEQSPSYDMAAFERQGFTLPETDENGQTKESEPWNILKSGT